ncbi:ethanolamine operon transcriptional regulator [Escherichia coli]|nr:ethanolamine operon transcriptional regulator [Escherichia coli]
MAMGAMLEEAQPMMTAESISHQSYRRLLSRAREYVLENMSEPVTVLDLCNQLHVSRRTLQNAFHAILGHWSERVAETYSPERRAPRTHKSVVTKHNGKRRRHAVGILASWAICHGLSATVCREAVTDAASADARVGVRELHPIPDLNKLT